MYAGQEKKGSQSFRGGERDERRSRPAIHASDSSRICDKKNLACICDDYVRKIVERALRIHILSILSN